MSAAPIPDAAHEAAASWLREDATTMEQTMRQAIELEKREARQRRTPAA